jgi:[protein-PII] uridylyltransferase
MELTAWVRERRDALVADERLGGVAFGRAYAELVDVWLAQLLVDGEGFAIVAIGGYGRFQLAPLSDLDVLLLHDPKREVDGVADALWYPIWDAGVRLDHSVRTVDGALKVSGGDLRAALGLLDARGVAGNHALVEQLRARSLDQWQARVRKWFPFLEAGARDRHDHPGAVPFVLEPDLKEGSGGLRDVTVLRALAAGVPVIELDQALRDAGAELFNVRVALHRVTGRSDDRLVLQHQDDVARLVGARDSDELMHRVASAGRTVMWHLDDGLRAVAATLAGPRRRSRGGGDVVLDTGVVRRDGQVAITADASPGTDDALVLRVAAAAARGGLPIARPTLRRLTVEAAVLDRVWPPAARDALVALLAAGPGAVAVFEALDQHELVTRLLPEWAPVRSRPQRNAFHRFTVDRHLVECAAQAAALTGRVARPDLLLVAAWLHDLGKGYPGDHTEAGVMLMRTIGTRLGYEPADVETLVTLVRHHLLLPAVATSRDLDDPATVAAVATTVGSEDVLALLAALTEADSIATGETAWTPWRAGLVQTLATRTSAALAGEAHVPTLPTPALDAALIERAAGGILVEGGERHLTVVAPDQAGLFSRVVGLLAVAGLDIRGARARSTVDGAAISEFDLDSPSGGAPDWARFEDDLRAVVAGDVDVDARVAERARRYRPLQRPVAARRPDVRVVVDNRASADATIVEVHAVDEIGVLYRIARVLAQQGLDIRHAKVVTLGSQVIDTFYVRAAGGKLEDLGQVAALDEAITTELGSPETSEAG